MRTLALALAAAAAAAAPVAAQPPPTSPQDFVAAAGGADRYEVLAAQVARVESRDPRIQTFAADMIRDHTAAEQALARAAQRSGLKPPSDSVGGDQMMLLAALQGARGAEFDRLYVRQQVLAHRGALATESDYARSGSDPNLKAAAAADLPMIQHHLQVVSSLAPGG